MIDRKIRNSLRYLVRQSQHTIYFALVPKIFSTVQRRVKDTPKAMHHWCIREIFFQVADWRERVNIVVVRKQRYF